MHWWLSMEYLEYKLGELLEYEQPTKYAVKSAKYDDEYSTPVLTAGKSFILGYTNETNGIYDNLPVIIFDDFTTATQYVNFKFKVKSSAMKILKANEELALTKYLYYLMQNIHCDHDTHKRYWIQTYSKIRVSIPSLTEQKLVVSKIEELFSKLDKGVEELNRIKEQLKIYRQAVLKEAFDGKSSFGNFETCEISNLVDDIKIGPFGTMLHKEDYINNGVPVINPQHIKAGAIVNSPNISVSRKKALELSSYKLQINDIIMGRRGEMGRVAPVTNVEEGWICGTGSILFRLKPEYDAKFYSKILESPDSVHYLEENATGTTMKNLNEKIVKHIPVPKITRTQQADIMSEVDRKLSVCDKIEQTVNESLQKAESLRQSILKQAFEGGL